jgi:AcrR family transcriptional regulator
VTPHRTEGFPSLPARRAIGAWPPSPGIPGCRRDAGETTIDALCERAGLTKRYFYESFTDREALLRAVYDAQIEPLKERLIMAMSEPGMSIEEQIDVGVGLFVDGLTKDVRIARIVFLESISGGPALRARTDEVIHERSDLVLALPATHLDGRSYANRTSHPTPERHGQARAARSSTASRKRARAVSNWSSASASARCSDTAAIDG